MKGYVHSLDSFGTVDGPGIRFVVFLQGCPLRCKYCHNPDTWQFGVGELMSVNEIYKKYLACKEFLKNGGLTVTGGEPLMQMEFVTELFKKFKENGVHTALDTSGITFSNNKREEFDKLLSYTDLVLLDLKHIDDEKHRDLVGHSNKAVLEFAEYLNEKEIPVWIRHVVVPGLTDDKKYLFDLGYFIGTLKNTKALDVLPYHKMGENKYTMLGIESPLKNVRELSKEEAVTARNEIMTGIKKRVKEEKAV